MRGKELLQKLQDYDLHVHEINRDDKPLPNFPIAMQALSTHYLMHDSDIVFVGSAAGLINYVEKNYKN